MSDETIIGPNRCEACGGEYGEHQADCYIKYPKLHPLTSPTPDLETMRRDVCEWAGWRNIHSNKYGVPDSGSRSGEPDSDDYLLPDLARDLNEVAQMEAKLNYSQKEDYMRHLYKVVPNAYIATNQEWLQFDEFWEIVTATATHRLEALHRTLFPEKWQAGKERKG